MDKILLTVPEFLRQYAISRTSFYSQVKQGKLRLLKRGRRSLIAKADADAWLEALRQSSTNGGDNA